MISTERRHDIDWLRVIAIGLLLIYHIAIVFQPWAMFVGFIRSETAIESLWISMAMLNVWRIPLLFFVSGMGVFFAMKQRNIWQLLLDRTKRILLPFAFGVAAITPLHFLLFQKFYNMPFSYYPHTGHLWFLGNIFVYVLLFVALFQYLIKNESGKFRVFISKLLSNPLGPIFLSLAFVVEAVVVAPQIFTLYAETWHGFFNGLLAFVLGFLLVYSGHTFWRMLNKWVWLYLVLAIALYTIRLLVYNTTSPNYLMAIESNMWILSVFGLAHKYLNRPSAILRYLSQSVYPVYIIHMFVLYAGGVLILPLEISPLLQFLAITLFTFVVCFLLFEFIIRRVNFLRPLFGLKWQTKK